MESALAEPYPAQCHYPAITASETINQLRDKWVVFMGESTLRQIFLQFLGVLQSEPWDRIPDQKGERKIEQRLAGSRFTFQYLEYYRNLSDELGGLAVTLAFLCHGFLGCAVRTPASAGSRL